MAEIDEKALEHLLKLARIEEPDSARRKKLLKDLSKILEHFNELSEVDTENVVPVSGGTFLTDVMRKDERVRELQEYERQREESIDQFPEKERRYLKVPPVFGE